MTPRAAKRLAWSIWVLTALLALADAALAVWNLDAWGVDVFGLPGEGALLGIVVGSLGVALATRLPSNPIGWLFCAMGPGMVLSWLPKEYAVRALVVSPGSLPGGEVAAWIGTWFWVIGVTPMLLVLLLFPDGRLPSPRWRVPAVVGTGALLAAAASAAVANLPPGPANIRTWVSPIEGTTGAATAVFQASFVAGIAVGLAAMFGAVGRLRRARSEERQQLKWFVFSSVILVLLTTAVDISLIFQPDAVGSVGLKILGSVLGLGFLLVLASIALAVLRYRLWDIDVVISKTVVFGALATFITAVYVLVVVGIGSLLGSGDEPNVGLSVVATAVLAVAFQPVRARVQRFANRLVYGERATPYEVMAGFSHRMAGTLSVDEVLPGMAQAAAEGVGAAEARALLVLPDGGEQAVWWPSPSGGTSADGFDLSVPVLHQGTTVGELSVRKPPGEPLTDGERRLLEDLASQAGLALHNVRLTSELRRRFDELDLLARELRSSRHRIVTAQDAERRRLERDIRASTERQLGRIADALSEAEAGLGGDPTGGAEAAELLERLGSETDAALDGLRDLARGLFPPLLADRGLVPALDAQVRKAAFPATLALGPGIEGARFDPKAEAAVYFCCVEALQNAARHATGHPVRVHLEADEGWLSFTVTDEGPGFDPAQVRDDSGLQTMTDRVEALGGTLRVRSEQGRGTTVEGRVPAAPADERAQPDGSASPAPGSSDAASSDASLAAAQASSSRSGPNDDLGM